jgi:hypothetical protein
VDEDRHALDLVLRAFERNNAAMQNRREAWLVYYSYYNQMYPDPEEEAQYTNNSFDPILAEKCETYRPFLCRRLPDLQFVPREDSDEEKARKQEFWQLYQYYRQGMKKKRQDLAFYTTLYGTGVLFHFYHKHEQEVWTRSFDQDGTVHETVKKKTLYDDPDCEVVDIMNDYFPDDIGTDIDSCHNIVFRQYIPWQELLEKSKGEDPWIKTFPAELEDSYGGYHLEEKKDALDRFRDSHSIMSLAEAGIVEILNYWEDDRLIIVANRAFVLRDSKNPFKGLRRKKPFTLFKFLDDPHQFWGKGLGDLCVKTQHVANVIERLKIDAAKDILRPKGITPFGSGIDPSPLYNGERYTIEGPATRAPIEWLPKPDFANIGLLTQADLRSRVDSVTGAPPQFSGMVAQGDQSATESRISQSNLMIRAFYVLGNQDAGFANWMKMNVGLAAQYYPHQRDIRIFNEQGGLIQGTITYDELMSGVDIEVKTNSGQPITADDRSLQADAMWSRFGQDPWVRPRVIRETAMKMFELPVDPNKLLYSEQEMAQMQEAQIKAAQDQDRRDKEHELIMAQARAMLKNDEEPAGPGMSPQAETTGRTMPAAGGPQ